MERVCLLNIVLNLFKIIWKWLNKILTLCAENFNYTKIDINYSIVYELLNQICVNIRGGVQRKTAFIYSTLSKRQFNNVSHSHTHTQTKHCTKWKFSRNHTSIMWSVPLRYFGKFMNMMIAEQNVSLGFWCFSNCDMSRIFMEFLFIFRIVSCI